MTMQPLFQWLAANSYVLLFAVLLGAVLLAKATIGGYGLGMVASAIAVGAAVSATSATMDVRLGIDGLTRSIFFYLFIYGVGLRIGPSLAHAFTGEGLKLTVLALLCSLFGLVAALLFARAWDLPAGAAGGILAGSMTMSTAIGAAEEAVRQGAFPLPAGAHFEDVSGMIALSYGLTYFWGLAGIFLVCKFLPRWWGVDIGAEAKRYEEQCGVPNVDDVGLTGYRPLTVRAYRLANDVLTGWNVKQFHVKHPQYKVMNVLRPEPARRDPVPVTQAAPAFHDQPMALAAAGGSGITRLREGDPGGHLAHERGVLPETTYVKLGAGDDVSFRQGDIITIGGRLDDLVRSAGLIGPELSDPKALNVPIDTAEIVVTNRAVEGRELIELRDAEFVGQVAIHHVERGGVPVPFGIHTRLQYLDVFFVAGIKSGVGKMAALLGRARCPGTPADLLLLSAGMFLGLAIGTLSFPLAGARVGFGNAGGLLAAGVIVSSLAARLRFFGNTPQAARNLLEDLGLVGFASILGINAGATLVAQLSGELAAKILVSGFVTCTLPPILAWAIGYHVMKINPAILVGAVAGARSQPGPACQAAKEIGSSVPWVGFPVAYAVSAVALTACGYLAMILSK
jgi:putative transport protein